MLTRIVSGGQTGVDRGALDAALAAGFECGGWCPKGRKAENGVIPTRYPLSEMKSAVYRSRTKQNVLDSDGTLILFFGTLTAGTRETLHIAAELGKPVLTLDCSVKPVEDAAVEAAAFVRVQSIGTLNVAGPRESSHAGGTDYARELVTALLKLARRDQRHAPGR